MGSRRGLKKALSLAMTAGFFPQDGLRLSMDRFGL